MTNAHIIKVALVAIATGIIAFFLAGDLDTHWRILLSVVCSAIAAYSIKAESTPIVIGSGLGSCSTIKKYLDNPSSTMKASYCNANSKNLVSKEANKIFHPNNLTNMQCQKDATQAYTQIETACVKQTREDQENVFEQFDRYNQPAAVQKPVPHGTGYEPWINGQEYVPNYNFVRPAPKPYVEMTRNELKEAALYGDVQAMHEQANRQPIRDISSNEFCTIM